jgi:hypothetical protein
MTLPPSIGFFTDDLGMRNYHTLESNLEFGTPNLFPIVDHGATRSQASIARQEC